MEHLSTRILYVHFQKSAPATWKAMRDGSTGEACEGLESQGLSLDMFANFGALVRLRIQMLAGHWPGTLTLRGAMASFRDKQWCACFYIIFFLLLHIFVFDRTGSVQEQHVQEGRPHRGTVVFRSRVKESQAMLTRLHGR